MAICDWTTVPEHVQNDTMVLMLYTFASTAVQRAADESVTIADAQDEDDW